jgi:hypothetical protein
MLGASVFDMSCSIVFGVVKGKIRNLDCDCISSIMPYYLSRPYCNTGIKATGSFVP